MSWNRMNHSKPCPCKGCTERTISCHGFCKRYQEWKAGENAVHQKFAEERSPTGMEVMIHKSMRDLWKSFRKR